MANVGNGGVNKSTSGTTGMAAEFSDAALNGVQEALTAKERATLLRLSPYDLVNFLDDLVKRGESRAAIGNFCRTEINREMRAANQQYSTINSDDPNALPVSAGIESAKDDSDLLFQDVVSEDFESTPATLSTIGTAKLAVKCAGSYGAALSSLSLGAFQHSSEEELSLHIREIRSMSKFTPLRLQYDERQFLRLLEGTLEVSEYTDKVDILHHGNEARKMANEIKQVCAVLSGLVVAHNYNEGQRLIQDRDFRTNRDFFRSIFEISRRYKILNPERMRDSYGKLIYLLMDAQRPKIKELLDFDCVIPVKTVADFLATRKNGTALLEDPLIIMATKEIIPGNKSRGQVQMEIRNKEQAIKSLCKKYATHGHRSHNKRGLFIGFSRLWRRTPETSDSEERDKDEDGISVDEVEQCLYSLADHNTYLRFNRDPCVRILKLLEDNFDSVKPEPEFSLKISAGNEGSRLSHTHERQYLYVRQSLVLWREILSNMYQLWSLAEADLLNPSAPYQLHNTGQGLQRLQYPPKVSHAMSEILSRTKKMVGGWIGSEAVHLGDRNVPNALLFIDKYTQIPRILGPLVLCLDKIYEIVESNNSLKTYVSNEFGGAVQLKKFILCDFFRHAFDGSGADNFFDAGSCIDGRLTSAWNWCSKIERKPYFPVMLLTGFTGFDGSFK
eukprot:Lankesteria_metandrocarpae@DN3553_c0_g2_i1.p1